MSLSLCVKSQKNPKALKYIFYTFPSYSTFFLILPSGSVSVLAASCSSCKIVGCWEWGRGEVEGGASQGRGRVQLNQEIAFNSSFSIKMRFNHKIFVTDFFLHNPCLFDSYQYTCIGTRQ